MHRHRVALLQFPSRSNSKGSCKTPSPRPPSGDTPAVAPRLVSRTSLRKRFESNIRKARLEQWADLFQVLRRKRETEWAERFPQYVVSAWLRHDIQVSPRHYLQEPAEVFQRASAEMI